MMATVEDLLIELMRFPLGTEIEIHVSDHGKYAELVSKGEDCSRIMNSEGEIG